MLKSARFGIFKKRERLDESLNSNKAQGDELLGGG